MIKAYYMILDKNYHVFNTIVDNDELLDLDMDLFDAYRLTDKQIQDILFTLAPKLTFWQKLKRLFKKN